jgi:serine/threonine-protein kinase
MSLTPGHQLGAYQILEPIGKGGMGEVYRARDAKLGREVAIKVLPEAFSQDADRLARFEREARILASLNHPGIATLHGLEDSEGVRFLVMELVPGETLEQRIEQGAIAIDEALPMFQQIAEALEAAHEKGAVHRDLKPANIKVTPEGKIKILDFGLARGSLKEASPSNLSESPTMTRQTEAGMILGTAHYMSPEQERGKTVDARADIWAFGCVLYEALTGRKVFAGDSVAEARFASRSGRDRILVSASPGRNRAP